MNKPDTTNVNKRNITTISISNPSHARLRAVGLECDIKGMPRIVALLLTAWDRLSVSERKAAADPDPEAKLDAKEVDGKPIGSWLQRNVL